VPYDDLEAMRAAISPATVAIMVEGVQGEGGVTPAKPEYLLGLRALCNEKKLLLLMDGVQCGHFRTGRFQSFQRILENCSSRREDAHSSDAEGGGRRAGFDRSLLASAATEFLPDAISMAKSLGGGFPIGAFWVRAPYADLLSAGTHGSTFGGSPLASAVALKILDVIQRERLADNARAMGELLKNRLQQLAQQYPSIVQNVRGLGLMIGFELAPKIAAFAAEGKSPAVRFANLLHDAGLLSIPAGTRVLRLLPPLNLQRNEAEEGLRIVAAVTEKLVG